MIPEGVSSGPRLRELAERRAHHREDGRFVNPWLPHEAPALVEIVRWKVSRLRERSRAFIPLIRPREDLLRDHPGPLACFLGHGTVLLRLAGRTLLLDPIFGHIGGVVRRCVPPPLPPERVDRKSVV